MNIEKFKQQHVEILRSISGLRTLVHEGIAANAELISSRIVAMSSIIKLHLAVEDSTLYPALRRSGDPALAAMGDKFQREMESIASAYLAFARKWNTGPMVARDPEGFRSDANRVLKNLHARMRKENTEFYPAIETA